MLKTTHPNYCATVIKIDKTTPLEGCDNVVGVSIFGYQAIVSKDIDLGVAHLLFTAETQLSEDFCRLNNMYRDSELNEDKSKKGYIEKHRRVKAVKFRGHTSSALIMSVDSVCFVGEFALGLGDTFNTINDIEVCTKYEPPVKQANLQGSNKVVRKSLVDKKYFPEHIDTENYFRNKHLIADDDCIYVTQKLHGTSGRFGYIKVNRELSLVEKIAKWFGVAVQETKYDYIAGSRQVIKYKDNQGEGYYKSDIWNETLALYKFCIPKDHIIYGEIIGRVGQSPIQKGYTYNMQSGVSVLFVYRVAIVNDDGILTDLTQPQLQKFCFDNGFLWCPVLWSGRHSDLRVEDFMDTAYSNTYPNAIHLSKDSPCDEGVVIRSDKGLTPVLLKAKCQTFLQHETKVLDSGEGIAS